MLKVKLGMVDGQDRRMIRLIREVNPSVPLYVDANQGWTDRYRALDMIAWLSGQGVVLVECLAYRTESAAGHRGRVMSEAD